MEGIAVRKRLAQSYAHYYRDTLGLPDWSERVSKRLSLVAEYSLARQLMELIGDLGGKRILDVGTGWGGILIAIGELSPSARIWGLEPDAERVELASSYLHSTNVGALVCAGRGEQIPLPDRSIDVVCAYQVLEHVECREKVVTEILRVLKPGGYFHATLPNYLAFSEPHYKMFWIPFLPKVVARLYLRLISRPEGFLRAFSYTTPRQMHRLLDCLPCTYRDLVEEELWAKLQAEQGSVRTMSKKPLKVWLLARMPRRIGEKLVRMYKSLAISRQAYLVRKSIG